MADLDQLLEKTSRTFALSIPLLPEPTRREVTVAYLLFRIADTFEDASQWPRAQRRGALEALCGLLDRPDEEAAARLGEQWAADLPIRHAGYLELLRETPFVLRTFADLAPTARTSVRHHTRRTALGMAGFVDRSDEHGELRLLSLQDLRDYCYVVAGIVGEMLTELFLLEREDLAPIAGELEARARWFGEGLQLVNILKDAAFDSIEGRRYLPPGIDRAEVFALARRDLELATEYSLALQRAGAPRGLVAFNALPVQLAWATLDKVENEGPGAKVPRPEVYRIVERLELALDRGDPAVIPPSAVRRAVSG
jgi:farnesyl-diphosphate farnesyltransferase